jgi:hypothetical protein
MEEDLLKKIKRHDCIKLLDDYYKSINRNPTPKYSEYSLVELKLCLRMFDIKLKLQGMPPLIM